MNYFYIDLGAYNGDTFLSFMNRTDLIVPPQDFRCILIEPNPRFHDLLAIIKEKFENIEAVGTGAAWIRDGQAEFAQDTNLLAYGSTLMKSKEEIWNVMPKIKVQTFDFSKWIEQFAYDYVIVKMDTEGAEFPILEKMLTDDTVRIMDQLWVEVHPNKVREYTTTYSNDLLDRLAEHTKVVRWH
jgi:FkbM family methyltransferase